MRTVTLGTTGITVPQNALGCLPLQRISVEDAVCLIRRAYEGGMRFFDTARSYSDSEKKVGLAFEGMRDQVYLATKTMGRTPEAFWKDLDTSLELLKTDHIDIYQFHYVKTCYRPGDGTGLYECMQQAKEQGKIRHIGVTTHTYDVAREIIESGLYETLQYPLSYLSTQKELELPRLCKEQGMGFIAMKGLAGGLITNSKAACAFMTSLDNCLPIWGVQRMYELEEWLSYMEDTPVLDEELSAIIKKDREELSGDFCRGCGYCMPCPAGILISNCARMSLMVRRAPSEEWLSEKWQKNMKMIEGCLHCNKCKSKCPYQLDTPTLLQKNYEDYKKILAGEVSVK